jgi:hypothetical protein
MFQTTNQSLIMENKCCNQASHGHHVWIHPLVLTMSPSPLCHDGTGPPGILGIEQVFDLVTSAEGQFAGRTDKNMCKSPLQPRFLRGKLWILGEVKLVWWWWWWLLLCTLLLGRNLTHQLANWSFQRAEPIPRHMGPKPTRLTPIEHQKRLASHGHPISPLAIWHTMWGPQDR